MTGYLQREREHVPMNREARIGSAIVIAGAILSLVFAAATIGFLPALHGKVSVVMPAMWVLGGSFIVRAGVASSAERVSPRWLRRYGWGVVILSGVAMIVVALV